MGKIKQLALEISAKTAKLSALAREYARAKEYESDAITHRLVKDDDSNRYGLVRKSGNDMVCFGDKSRIQSYMRLRKIKTTQVFDYNKYFINN